MRPGLATGSRLTALVLAAGLIAWTVNTALLWLGAAPLGHDEAQYALAAQDMLAGEPPRWFYLSPGTAYLALPGVALGGGEIALRLPAFLMGLGFCAAAAAVAWRCFGAATAAWVVALLAGTRAYARLGGELLSDLPATACLLGATAILVGEVLREDGPRRRTVWAAPLLAAALYLRFASCVPIAILGVAALGFGLRGIRRRPWPVVATAIVFLGLLVPHALSAIDATGSPLGILLASEGVPHRAYRGEGLVDYLRMNPFSAHGVLAPPVLIAGIAAGLCAIARRRDRRTALLWTVAVADIIAIGLISHAQVRYIAYGTALLLVLGVDVLRGWVAARSARARAGLAAAAGLALIVSWALVARAQLRAPARRQASMAGTLAAAAAIRADAAGRRCHAAAEAFTQIEWYSGCVSSAWPWHAFGREPVYIVYAPAVGPGGTRGTPRQLLVRSDLIAARYDP